MLGRIIGGRGYEGRFDQAMMSVIVPGDCVWDVGANVGLYTRRFLAAVAPRGQVIAVEPSPGSASVLRALCTSNTHLRVEEVALSDEDGSAQFSVSAGETSVVNHLSDTGELSVRMKRADALVREGLPEPDVIKIDVEGFEGEVLAGMTEILRGERCRALFVEVHFAALSARHKANEPARIVRILEENGFKTRWLDHSHLAALR
jgi:FkbM family methyltransferase